MNNTEVELKLLIDPADIPKLRRHPLLKSLCPSGPKTRKPSSTYFDTDEFDLKSVDHNDILINHGIGVMTGWIACKTVIQLANMKQVWKNFYQCPVFWAKKKHV